MASEYLTVAEFSALVRVPAETVRRLIRSGKLDHVKIGGQYRLLPPTPVRAGEGTGD
jgi:excisionase family DNA binding protein